jgi:hypothetical protein
MGQIAPIVVCLSKTSRRFQMQSKPPSTCVGNCQASTLAAAIFLAFALAQAAYTQSAPEKGLRASSATVPQSDASKTAPCNVGSPGALHCKGPYPMLSKGHPVTWWFVFKFNTEAFPGCGSGFTRACPFGGTPQNYSSFGQQYAYASSDDPELQKGSGCTGDTSADPVGATFDEVYNGTFHFLIWNDQFYDDPAIEGCSQECGSPWGHSKGMLVWDDTGEGFVMQVSTPSWPSAGSAKSPRKSDGNSLGCTKDNNVEVSQHFFSLHLTKDDVVRVLQALGNASVATDPTNAQIVSNGGPADIQQLVSKLGVKSTSEAYSSTTLSTGVQLLSKPSRLHVPPWQMVSAILGGIALRTATWWAAPEIYSTSGATAVTCWDASLTSPGPVQIATTGTWEGKTLGLTGGLGDNFNHAKLGVSTAGANRYTIFGDMNQQGAVAGADCSSSQNGRGGLFYVVINPKLSGSVSSLLNGATAPEDAPAK